MTGPSVRVLVVDDSVVVRRVVQDVLQAERDFEVVATAVDGEAALEVLERLPVDVVILDVEMPRLDGLETLRRLRPRWPSLPVIMFSTLTERGASATLDALALGASDYLTKPTRLQGPDAARAAVADQLVPLVRTWGRIGRRSAAPSAASAPARPPRADPPSRPSGAARRRAPISAVLIGSSTGGPSALAEIVPALPATLDVPVLVVQHMPPMFTRMLAERLDQRSALRVVEGAAGTPVRPGTVYVAPGGVHMVANRTREGVRIEVDDGPPENSVKPAVDVLLRSGVDAWGGEVLTVILTGMGYDGLAGARRVVEAGGVVLAQDEQSSVVWGMPGAVVTAGMAEQVLPLGEVAAAIGRYVERPRVGARP